VGDLGGIVAVESAEDERITGTVRLSDDTCRAPLDVQELVHARAGGLVGEVPYHSTPGRKERCPVNMVSL
jgi:hypothetical protein